MAKKKKSKETETKTFQYSVELTGLVMILIGLIGFTFSPVGEIIKKFAMFLVGEWWFLILVTVLILGLYMLIKRKLPKFFTSRLVGFYIVFLVILIISHKPYIDANPNVKGIFQTTLNTYMDRINDMPTTVGIGISENSIGGGIIGCAFAFLLGSLFDNTGLIIFLVVLSIFGIVMLFDITLADIFEKIKNFFVSLKNKEKNEVDDDDDEEEENKEEDGRVIITSMDELKPTPPTSTEDYDTANAIPKIVSTNPYTLPPIDILEDVKKGKRTNTEFLKNNKIILERVLNDFQIKGTVTEIHSGPAVTQFEVSIPAGTKVSRVSSIQGEIKMALAAKEIRVQAPIPGKSTIGVEVPNPEIVAVKIKEILGNIPPNQMKANILVSLGKDIMGRVQTADLSKMPHLLVAGSTGSGKSVCINSFIASILMRYRPDEVKLMLVDPKKVELSNYNGIPHLICPVVTDPKKASLALQRVVGEMEKRYDLFSETGVKNIAGYNEYVEKNNQKNPSNPIPKLHYIVSIIDELADLMLVAAKEVEDSIMRITQMARAAGIHLIVATQRPSTDVITGVVKANIPSRISFAVASGIDSRTILDQQGAEKLLGKGDMLYLPMGENAPIRIQGSFISDEEVEKLINYVCKQQTAQYDNTMTEPENNYSNQDLPKEDYEDPIYNEIVEFALQQGKISASLIQRRFRLGYNRAARVIDLLEERGIIGPANGSKPREVLVKLEGSAANGEK